MATATESGARVRYRSAEEMREVVDRVLAQVDGDERSGPLLHATGMRLRLRIPDLDLAVNICASDAPEHCIRWSFAKRAPWKPRLELTMESPVANAYLQGAASVPVAIARGEIQCAGDVRAALLYLPAAKLITDPYRELVVEEYSHLVIDSPATAGVS